MLSSISTVNHRHLTHHCLLAVHHVPIVTVTLLLLLSQVAMVFCQLSGVVHKCDNEGDEVKLPFIEHDPCIKCFCQKGVVRCSKEHCPSVVGCHALLTDKPTNSCCPICRGCWYNGRPMTSGSQVTDDKTCRTLTCHAGIITASHVVCVPLCHQPIAIKGQCCPACSLPSVSGGCKVGKQVYREGEHFVSKEDRCAQCQCKNGGVVCQKTACPVLNCASVSAVLLPGACCPSCNGSREIIVPAKRCYFQQQIYRFGSSVSPDPNTDCKCLESTMVCERQTCPAVKCGVRQLRLADDGSLCPQCPQTKAPRRCTFHGRRYRSGKQWRPDLCTSCECLEGTVRCFREHCSNSPHQCPPNMKLSMVAGACCPQCVHDDGVCAVFGDPHYRTFDGRVFSYQGTCKYVLARDCGPQHRRSFSVLVQNAPRNNERYSWTKSVTVVTQDVKVLLLPNMRIRINRKLARLPYTTNTLTVRSSGNSLVVQVFSVGIKLTWDSEGYLELVVPPSFRSNLCGLCGNFNDDQLDDFRGRDGLMYFEATDFSETWLVSRKNCQPIVRNKNAADNVCQRNPTYRQHAHHDCRVVYSAHFTACHRLVDAQPFYQSCMADMCHCTPTKYCACHAIRAYIASCEHVNARPSIAVPPCHEFSCPLGSRWSVCAPECPETCDTVQARLPSQSCDSDQCRAGCQCEYGLVLNGSHCISPQHCPEV